LVAQFPPDHPFRFDSLHLSYSGYLILVAIELKIINDIGRSAPKELFWKLSAQSTTVELH
jgi:hypothetical protein